MKLSDATNAFLRHCRLERGLTKLTMAAYRLDLRQFREMEGNRTPVAEIDKHIIRWFLGWLDTRYKPPSIKRKLVTLKSFFIFLEQEEYIEASPFRKLRLRLDRAKSLPRTLPITSVTELLQSAYAAAGEASETGETCRKDQHQGQEESLRRRQGERKHLLQLRQTHCHHGQVG